MKASAVTCLALAVILAVPCAAQSRVPPDLRAAMQRRYVTILRLDVANWDRLTADDFILVNAAGTVFTKAQRIAQMKTQQPDTTSATQAPQETVHVYGTAAVERYDGGGAWVQLVWSKDAKGWRVHTAQVTPIQPDSTAVSKAIDANNATFFAALKRGDVAALTASYTPGGVLMIPNMPVLEGADAIRQGFTGFLGQFAITDGKLATHDVVISGPYAIERGTYQWTLHPKTGTGSDVMDTGKYLTVWELQGDGSWKIVRDINNSDRAGSM